VSLKLLHNSNKNLLQINAMLVVQTFLSESHYTTVRGPDILRNRIVSGYVAFYEIHKFFVNTLRFHY